MDKFDNCIYNYEKKTKYIHLGEEVLTTANEGGICESLPGGDISEKSFLEWKCSHSLIFAIWLTRFSVPVFEQLICLKINLASSKHPGHRMQ